MMILNHGVLSVDNKVYQEELKSVQVSSVWSLVEYVAVCR